MELQDFQRKEIYMVFNNQTDNQSENGLQEYWLLDKRVAVKKLLNSTDATVDRWYNSIIETIENWPSSYDPILILDVSDAPLTPNARKRTFDLDRKLKELPVFIILVLPDTPAGRIIFSLILRRRLRPKMTSRTHLCFNMEAASMLAGQFIELLSPPNS